VIRLVKINYSPIQELVVHDIFKMNFEDLLRGSLTPMGAMPLYWCEGILYRFSSIPMSEEIAKLYVNGSVHWAEVHYTDGIKEYKQVLELKDENYQGGSIKVRVMDMSGSTLHSEFIRWLKANKDKLQKK
jgi:hypothetical protein